MTVRTLRGRVALWTVAIVSGALILFGGGAAWNLRKKLVKNLDNEIAIEGRDLISEIEEERLDWSSRKSAEAFLKGESNRFHYVLEVHDAAGRVLYRSANLGNQKVFPAQNGNQPYEVSSDGHRLRFRVFQTVAIRFAMGKDLAGVRQTLAELALAYLLTLPFVLIAVGAGGWWIAHRAATPLKAITRQAKKISASDLHQRLAAPSSRDSIGHLTVVLNEMFDRLERSFEQVTRFASDASHELKTPIALMRVQLDTTLGSETITPPQRELLSDLIEQCSQLSQIVDGLLFFSRADDRRLAIEQGPVDLVALVHELCEDAEILAAQAKLTLRCQLPAQLVVTGDARLLRRAVMNLIDNAIKYNRADGIVVLTASTDRKNAMLAVRNTGPSIALAAREKVFERFHRSDFSQSKEKGGHGLGLSIAREIARAHRGDVNLLRSDTEWTEFCVVLPIARIDAAAEKDWKAVAVDARETVSCGVSTRD
jgi:signal transduction histidine kinase